MAQNNCLLFEVGVEELPIDCVFTVADDLKHLVAKTLNNKKLSFSNIDSYATPRRIAILVSDLANKQEDFVVEKKGPSLNIAYDEKGQPTKALEGFARANQVEVADLEKKEMNGTDFMVYRKIIVGQPTTELIGQVLDEALKKLPIAKPMRWGSSKIEFIRPIHWVCLIYKDKLIKTNILGVETSNQTHGHRFHAPHAIGIKHANNYKAVLEKTAFVMPSFADRKQYINEKVHQIAKGLNAIAVVDEKLLNQVTGLVEWPVPLVVDFDKAFLNVPEEALISAMQTHQKVFHLLDKSGQLLPKFITVANIESSHEQSIVKGNARVMNARLADAAFFYKSDTKVPLQQQLEKLKRVIFQRELGTLMQRAQRLAKIAVYLAKTLSLDESKAQQAGLLAKADLVTQMVEEFPELQGTMGYHYALNQGLDPDIAMGIRGQYMPRFAEDSLPMSNYGCLVSIADRIDKLTGIFGINQPPTGEKDPFALRRAAIGLLSIIIGKHFCIDLKALISFSSELYGDKLKNPNVNEQVFEFIMERLKYWYQNKGTKIELFNAVHEKQISEVNDFNLRLNAITEFLNLEDAQALAHANKRVSKLLQKENLNLVNASVDQSLFTEAAEKNLSDLVDKKQQTISPLLKKKQYADVLKSLADLREPVDAFFAEVRVITDDERLKQNRLLLLLKLKNLFLEVADVSKL